MQKMKNLGNGVSYIGMDDLTLDLFEGQYILPEGVSYNSYLIDDEKIEPGIRILASLIR